MTTTPDLEALATEIGVPLDAVQRIFAAYTAIKAQDQATATTTTAAKRTKR